jgi:predicted RNA-binding Zn-ribbon protein involved in translation (DUF1610 family)
MSDYVAPVEDAKAFTCPHCGVYAHQNWGALTAQYVAWTNVKQSTCAHCNEVCIWRSARMIDPAGWIGPMPHERMPADVKALYIEASEIGGRSPRAAAALLRLSLQVLVLELEPDARDINAGIGALVRRGLDEQVQQAMDVVRVVGNNAVHPGELQVDEDPRLVPALFELVNLIVEQVIARPERLASLFASLPEKARDGVENRDKGARDDL